MIKSTSAKMFIKVIMTLIVFVGVSSPAFSIEPEKLTIKTSIAIDSVDKNISSRTSGEVQIRRLKNILYSDKAKANDNLFDELLVLQKKVREKK